jgi:trans-aconitate 2-methyltransferase
MPWDPKIYLNFAAERTRPAAELLARIAVENPKHVADLGCGPGNSTELLAARWPEAQVEGIDSSPEMIAKAKASGIRANWTLSDIANWQPPRAYDVVFSNATYQWLPDHQTLLPRLVRATESGGIFAFQVPNNFESPSHALMREVGASGVWAAKLKGVRNIGVLSPARYYDILAPLASALDIWQTEYLQVLDGEDPVYRWVSATGLRPFADALAGDERDAFVAAFKSALRAAYPMRADGKTLFPFKRLFAVATAR